jgi:predicted alpha/beta hydrolase family esterase
MKAYIVHGWDGNPNESMLQWLKSSLEARDYQVTVPAMPDPGTPKIEAWVGKLAQTIVPDGNTILIGHSVGCQAVLRYIQALSPGKRIRGIMLIAPWMKLDEKTIEEEGEEVKAMAKPWMETPIDFKKVKSLVGKTVAIFSDNDPYVPLDQKAIFEKELNAEIIVEKRKGHFTMGEGVKTLPSALNAALGL